MEGWLDSERSRVAALQGLSRPGKWVVALKSAKRKATLIRNLFSHCTLAFSAA
jgi:hypothetical protein